MLWIKAFHIIAVICWFAGIFYLPRLFVYHAMAEDQKTQDHLKIMERKLYRFVTPFMIITVVLGIYLMSLNFDYYKGAIWFHIKSLCVILLIIYHFYCGKLVKDFAADKNQRSQKYYRIFNELPVLLLFIIIIMVIVRPF
jgi:putative membrane protein